MEFNSSSLRSKFMNNDWDLYKTKKLSTKKLIISKVPKTNESEKCGKASAVLRATIDITDHEEFEKEDEFNLKTTYTEENAKVSDEILQKYSIFEPSKKLDSVAPIREPKALKRLRRELREKTLGDRWGDMKKQDINPDLQNDLAVLQLRKFLNPKSFFKSSENKNLPKYYQVGTIVAGGDDFVGGRLKKKDKKNSLVELFLKEDGDLQFSKRKFMEIQKEKQKRSKRRMSSFKFRKLKKMGKSIKRR